MHSLGSFVLLSLASQVACWGGLGHRTVGYLAQQYLNEDAGRLVEDLIKPSAYFDISDAAVWADNIRHNRGYTEGWHFIDAKDSPPEQCSLDFARDCKVGQGCVVSAISNQTSILLDLSSNQHIRNEALKFLLHFIGDVHQPLHAEDLSRGGNDIPVSFDNHHTQRLNLHSVWDSAIARKLRGLRFDAHATEEKPAAAIWADELAERIKAGDAELTMTQSDTAECTQINDPNTCGIQWAAESNRLVCSYVLAPGLDWVKENDLGGEYYEAAAPVVERQIARAGVRAAAWINAVASAAAEQAAFKGDLR